MRKFFLKMAVYSVISMGFLTYFLVAGPVFAQGSGDSVAKPATPAAFVDKIGIDLLDSIRNGTITGPTGKNGFVVLFMAISISKQLPVFRWGATGELRRRNSKKTM